MKFTIYDSGRREYLFDKKKFCTRAEAKQAIIKDFMIGEEKEYLSLKELMTEGKLEFHFDDGRILKYVENDEKKITKFMARLLSIIGLILLFFAVIAPEPKYMGMSLAGTIIAILSACHLNTLSNEK